MKDASVNGNFHPDFDAHSPNFDTARKYFESYLQHLPATLHDLQASVNRRDVYYFRQLINKLIPQMKQVGLNELANTLQAFDAKCITVRDLILHETEIQHIIKSIGTSKESTSRILARLIEFTGSNEYILLKRNDEQARYN